MTDSLALELTLSFLESFSLSKNKGMRILNTPSWKNHSECLKIP